MRRLAEYDPGFAFRDTVPLDTVADQELTINSVDVSEGHYGLVVVMDVTLPDGTRKKVRTSATIPVRMLLRAVEDGGFPLAATFYRKGRYWNVR